MPLPAPPSPLLQHTKNMGSDAKKPPGNGTASSFGRIVPTEAKPSELSGCILSLAQTGVKAKTLQMQLIENRLLIDSYPNGNIRSLFACQNRSEERRVGKECRSRW